MKKQILVVDTDARSRGELCAVLRTEGYEVKECADGAYALVMLRSMELDLVVVDMHPDRDGDDLCREIREGQNLVPILMLAEPEQDLGADDYVSKPVDVRELLARVQVLLQRPEATMGPARDCPDEITFGSVRIDCRALSGTRGDKAFELSPRELMVMTILFREWGQAVSRDVILNEVWGIAYYGTTRILDQMIVKLRRKLEDVPSKPSHLLTVHDYGYRLE